MASIPISKYGCIHIVTGSPTHGPVSAAIRVTRAVVTPTWGGRPCLRPIILPQLPLCEPQPPHSGQRTVTSEFAFGLTRNVRDATGHALT